LLNGDGNGINRYKNMESVKTPYFDERKIYEKRVISLTIFK